MELVRPDVIGGEEVTRKASAVDNAGALRTELIEGVRFRSTRPVPHEDGHLTEIARADWEMLGGPVVQVHLTTTLPSRVRAWGLHQEGSDRLFVAQGLVTICVFDGRNGSPSQGRVNEFTLSERNPGLLLIPPNLYHGWRNIGSSEALIINMPTRLYRYDQPDALDLPWDCEEAARIIPYRW